MLRARLTSYRPSALASGRNTAALLLQPRRAGRQQGQGWALPLPSIQHFSSSASEDKQTAAATSLQSSSPALLRTETLATTSSSPFRPKGVLETIKRVLSAAKAEKELSKKQQQQQEGSAATGQKASDAAGSLDKASLRRLLTFMKPEAVPLGISVATLTFTTAISLLFPYAIGQILDVALSTNETLTPTTISLGLLGLFGIQSSMIVLRSALLTISGERMSNSMRDNLFKAMLAQDTAFFDRQRVGDLVNRLSADSSFVQKALTNNVTNGLRSFAMVLGGTGMLLYLSPSLALLSLALIPPVAGAGMYYGRYIQAQQKALQKALGSSMNVAEEILSGHKTVRQFAREGLEAARFRQKLAEAYQEARSIGVAAAYFDGLVHMAANVGLIAVLWYGGSLVQAGQMSAGDLTAFLMYSLYTGFNASSLSSTYSDLKKASGAAARMFEVMDAQPQIPLAASPSFWKEQAEAFSAAAAAEDTSSSSIEQAALRQLAEDDSSLWLRRLEIQSPRPTAAEAAVGASGLKQLQRAGLQGSISFSNVSFTYPTRPDASILQGFSLQVPAGSSVAIVGSSGSGKSTVAALLTRLYDPSQGSVAVDGQDIRGLDPASFREHIGVVSQEPLLFSTSILENIRFGKPTASMEEVISAAKIAHCHDFISALPEGYHTKVGEKGSALSGGEKQRVAIARAVIRDPRILILDEATSALPVSSEEAILASLRALSKGRTVISIAHRLSTMRNSDYIALVKEGKVAAFGSFQQLLEQPQSEFRQLIAAQLVSDSGSSSSSQAQQAAEAQGSGAASLNDKRQ